MNLNMFDQNKRTVLMYAVIKKSKNTVKVLCDLGADVNMQDKNGTTALMYAANKHDTEIIDCLCQHKANVTAEDYDNTNVFLYAINDLESTKTLLKYIPKDHDHIINTFRNVILFKRSRPDVPMESDYCNFLYNYIKESEYKNFLEQHMMEPIHTYNTNGISSLANTNTQREKRNNSGKRNTNPRNNPYVRPTEVNRTATTSTSVEQNSESTTTQKKSRKRKKPYFQL